MKLVDDKEVIKSPKFAFSELSAYIISSTVATTVGTVAGHPLDTVIVSTLLFPVS